jgi:release factor glutamine methyltransferase
MAVNIQTIKDIRLYLTKELIEIYNESEINAFSNLIIKTETGMTRLHQINNIHEPVTSLQAGRIIAICEELKTGKPIQYILGETVFYDCVIKLSSATLIPRPETEELVDLIIRENKGYSGKIIDFGTGSGCIAIALAINLPGSKIEGIDISVEALTIARENALINKAVVTFRKGDVFSFVSEINEKTGIIVSNPPYVRNSEKQFMSKNVLGFEPHDALFVTDSDPLVFYRAILKIAENTLSPGGRLYFEINETMGKAMTKLFEEYGYSGIEVVADLNGKERMIKGRKNV